MRNACTWKRFCAFKTFPRTHISQNVSMCKSVSTSSTLKPFAKLKTFPRTHPLDVETGNVFPVRPRGNVLTWKRFYRVATWKRSGVPPERFHVQCFLLPASQPRGHRDQDLHGATWERSCGTPSTAKRFEARKTFPRRRNRQHPAGGRGESRGRTARKRFHVKRIPAQDVAPGSETFTC